MTTGDFGTENHASLLVVMEQVRGVRSDIAAMAVDLKTSVLDHEIRIRTLEKQTNENTQRIGVIAMAQGAYTTITAAIATWLGTR